MKNKVSLTTGSVPRAIIQMTLPMMIGMIGIVAFNLVDTFFIGKLGITALAAMSFTFPVVMLQGAISMGLGVGASAVISKAIGANDVPMVKRLTTDALILSLSLVIIVLSAGLVTINPLFTALGASSEHLPLIREYMVIWYCGVLFVVIPMVGNSAIRATGNTNIPSIIMMVGVIINCVLDPLLIFGIGPFPRLELKGAAIATVFARCTTLVISLLYLHFKFHMLTLRFPSLVKVWESWKKILYIAVPTALTQVLLPLSMGFLTRLVAGYGENAVAALGVANRIEMFALAPLIALGSVLVPFTGQNNGAKQPKRILEGVSFSNYFSLGLGIMVFIVFLLFRHPLASLFNSTKEVVSIVGAYLAIVSIGYGFQGITSISGSTFSALNKPFNAAGVNLLRLIIFLIPLTIGGSYYWGLTGIFGAITVSSFLSGGIAMIWVKRSVLALNFE